MKTLISIEKKNPTVWRVETISSARHDITEDLYFEVATQIDNKGVFYTDSNGWLVMKRELFKH